EGPIRDGRWGETGDEEGGGGSPSGFYPRFNPFFFLCTHHGEMEGPGAEGGGEVLLTFQIHGSPGTYVPGQEYQVTISTSTYFDGLLVTGLYTSTSVQSSPIPASPAFGFGVMSDRQFGTQFVCSVVASHVSHLPSTSLSFIWIAPPPGTGCVNFMATATHRGQIIFKDALAQQLCEQGAVVHGDHAVLRDDFEHNSQEELNLNIWSDCSNCEVGEQCGALMHGKAVTFCEPFGQRELTTVALNTSTASVLQFAFGSGSCRFSYSDPSIIISCGLNSSDDWITLEKIRAPTNSSTVVHLLPLPPGCKGEAVHLRWSQEPPVGPDGYESCWGLDNILVLNTANRPPLLEDSLDPLDTANWLFFPGATVKHACQSEGNSLYFHGGEGFEHSFASTRDVDLHREEGRSYWEEDFEMLCVACRWEVDGAVNGVQCGEVESGSALVFLKDGQRKVCTPYLNTTAYGNLRFHFTMGGGDCDPGESNKNNVVLFGRSEGRKDHVMYHSTISLISFVIYCLQTPATQFCLEQKFHGGANRHVWAVDFLQLLPVLPGANTHLVQFSINLGCGAYQPANSVKLEFSTNHGRSWSLLHTECLPELCAGSHLPHSSIYSSENYSGWTRITIPLPNSALTDSTRFRWRQTAVGSSIMWAIDNVYIGPSCLRFCSGRGHCSRTGCKCDHGFSGPACELVSQNFPAFLSESFSSVRLSSYHSFSSLRGAEVSFACGVLASGKALVFNRDSRRHIVTTPLDSSQARYLQFTLRLGSRSTSSSCPAPDQPGEGVLLHYSSDNGITWTLLQHYAYQGFHEPRIVSVELPPGARKFGVQFRWWQPYHSGRGQDVWALDEISITSILFNIISLDFSNVLDVTQSLGFYLGNVQPYCQHDWTLSFSGDHGSSSSIRYVETQSMQIGASYMIQFSLVMGCGREPSPHIDTQVRLEFSTNHGLTWHLVKEACLPGMPSCSEFTASSVYHPSEFTDWRRITLPLPYKTWSSATRFRWIQNHYQEQDEWALDDVYIGQQCPQMCRGHGWCDHGHCRCDEGFTGSDCQTLNTLASSVLSDFESQETLVSAWQEATGGEIVPPDQGCGVVSSGSSLYFSRAGLRQLVSWDLDTEWAEFVQFYLRMGGDGAECNQADSREEGLLLQYSNDGGISWGLIAEMYFTDFTKPRFVHYELPLASKTPCTRFRWWQPLHSGEGYDQWAIDDVIILSEREKHVIPMADPTLPQNFYEKPAFDHPLNQMSVWLMLGNEGMDKDRNGSFCAPTPSALVFGRSDGDRMAVTRDLALRPGYTLQFKLNIGCESVFSASAPVLLQYSHDAGRTWALVREGCYPASPGATSCEGSGRELREPTVYHTGDYERWTRVTVVLPRIVAASKTRFRWFQESSVYRDAPAFALDGVYISEPCPNHCGGHGDCISGVCFCDMGYTGNTHMLNVSFPTELVEDFEGKLSPLWQSLSGGQIGDGCGSISEGKALYFSSLGRREACTTPLDTTHTRSVLVQFYIRIGGKNMGSTCSRPRSRNEGVIVQFSINNGVQWQLLRELDFGSFLEPQVVTIELPPAAKTPHTVFRWWQPQQGKHSAQWGLDNVLIGMNDSARSGFFDTFDGTSPLRHNWYRVVGGEVTADCLSPDSVLNFNSEVMDKRPRYAESWDFEVSGSSFLQFDLSMGCSKAASPAHGVHLEFSTDCGRHWTLITPECVPPAIGCSGYTQRSVFSAPQFLQWRRVTVYLPSAAISPRTRFRWIQPLLAPGADDWALDNVLLTPGCPWMCSGHGLCDNGHCVCDKGFGGPHCVPLVALPSVLKEDFNENLRADVWPEVYGAERGTLSGEPLKSGTALIFKGVSIAMEIKHKEEVWVIDDLIIDGNTINSLPVILDSFEGGPQEGNWLFYPGGNTGFYCPYQRAGLTPCSMRFRWYQGFYSGGAAPPTWALDSVYIGPQCQNMCNGHGVCVRGTHCSCDPGYSGPDCSVPDMPNLDFLKEDFEGGVLESEYFKLMSGGKPSRKCGITTSGNHLFFSEDGLRMLETLDLDLSNARFIQFFLRLGCGKAAPDPRSQPVLLQFSVDGGLNWALLQEFLYSNSSNQAHLVALEIPLRARTSATRLRWWQPSENGHFHSPWVIDKLVVGGSASGWGPLEDDFSSTNGRSWLLHPGGTRMPVCGSDGEAFAFIEKSNTRYGITTDISLGPDAFIQFDFSASCSVTSSCYMVELEYSLDLGLTWLPLVKDCLPTSPDCSSYTLQRLLVSDTYNKWGRVTLPIPHYARSTATRFRWFQPAPFDKQQTWALDNLYIGDGCPEMCSGHGRCRQSSCVCDPEWGGEFCDEPLVSLPAQLKDSFSRAPALNHWHLLTGGKISSVCGAVASGSALHFSGSCSRQLVTVDLNLTSAEFIQFYFMYGCMIAPSNRNQGVLLEFSVNAGISWNLLTEIFYDQYSKPEFVNVLLPAAARAVGVRIRWWQPQHDGADRSDWALDNVLISGSDAHAQISDTFGGAALPSHERAPADGTHTRHSMSDHWLFSEDCSVKRFCSSPDGVMVCGNTDGQEVYAVTHDIVPAKGWVMQFKIAVGCSVPEKPAERQIHVQYSVNFGVTWKYLVPQCLPADPRCAGLVSQPSVFFPADGWKRAVYPLPDGLADTAVRFRFYQRHSDTQWAVENFYIGPACENHCGGHGDCLDQHCLCDPGFTGPSCYASTTLKVNQNPVRHSRHVVLLKVPTATPVLKTFVEYWAKIGSEENVTLCHRPTCRKEGVLLDYSIDGGVSWTLLHEMDYLKYVSVRRDYIVLPERALTNATRLRWWQPFSLLSGLVRSSAERAQWALDNILVGGSDINPSTLLDTFDDEGVSHEESWSFYPNAVRTAGFCGNPSFHLYWPNKNQDGSHNILATRELIVQPGYILQFKIVVGCEADRCDDRHSVLVQYRKDARSDVWQLVQSACLPSSANNVGCSPFQFHESTIYSPVNSSVWTRATIQLPDHVSSGATQFRWIQHEAPGERYSWAMDHVYIGEACPGLCSGHGYCTSGPVCICDEGHQGDDCSLSSSELPSSIKDNFESGSVSQESWSLIQGGGMGSGCGQLSPHAHGDSLYFNGCKIRQAITRPLDLTRASKIMFVLQIGSVSQTDSCNAALDQADMVDRAVLLQYSVNNGVSWNVIAQHQPKDFIKAQRVSYNIPLEARVRGVQLRWWQPRHEGAGHDQWALDHVEVILTRKQNYMMNYSRQTGLHHYYNRKRRALRQQT
uniref:Reelin n=1 Tax=Sinocyclocheilus rhinocerous TaxID=307959 RepID=A0A673MNI9_9TELE